MISILITDPSGLAQPVSAAIAVPADSASAPVAGAAPAGPAPVTAAGPRTILDPQALPDPSVGIDPGLFARIFDGAEKPQSGRNSMPLLTSASPALTDRPASPVLAEASPLADRPNWPLPKDGLVVPAAPAIPERGAARPGHGDDASADPATGAGGPAMPPPAAAALAEVLLTRSPGTGAPSLVSDAVPAPSEAAAPPSSGAGNSVPPSVTPDRPGSPDPASVPAANGAPGVVRPGPEASTGSAKLAALPETAGQQIAATSAPHQPTAATGPARNRIAPETSAADPRNVPIEPTRSPQDRALVRTADRIPSSSPNASRSEVPSLPRPDGQATNPGAISGAGTGTTPMRQAVTAPGDTLPAVSGTAVELRQTLVATVPSRAPVVKAGAAGATSPKTGPVGQTAALPERQALPDPRAAAPTAAAPTPPAQDAPPGPEDDRPTAPATVPSDTISGTQPASSTALQAGDQPAPLADTGADRGPQRIAPPVQASPPDLPRHNLADIARVSVQYPHRQVELILSPDELGAVRMTLANTDAGTTMAIVADRPETLDLLRRNIDILAQDFRNLGLGDVSFSFSGGTDRSAAGRNFLPQDDAEPPDQAAVPTMPATAVSAPPAAVNAGSGLDLRF